VNRRFGLAFPAFRSSCQTAAYRFRAARPGRLRSGRCRGSAPIPVSAMFSQLLRGGVNAKAVRGAIDRFAQA